MNPATNQNTIAHGLDLEYEFPLELTSSQLTEALVAARMFMHPKPKTGN